MFGWLTAPSKVQRTAESLYERLVTAARNPDLYTAYGVPDDAEGRFEMVALHLFLALEGIKSGGDADAVRQAVTQRVIETFVTDMDDCMREMGVGDLAVPKRVKRAAAGFYERAGAYRTALEAGTHDARVAAVTAHVFASADHVSNAAQLADYLAPAFQIVKGASADTVMSDVHRDQLRALTTLRAP